MLVEDAAIPKPLQIDLQRFEFDASIAGNIGEGQGAEIGLTGFRQRS